QCTVLKSVRLPAFSWCLSPSWGLKTNFHLMCFAVGRSGFRLGDGMIMSSGPLCILLSRGARVRGSFRIFQTDDKALHLGVLGCRFGGMEYDLEKNIGGVKASFDGSAPV
ncbi:MAG: hypothetical protein ACREVM_06135, partial [Burkholderiales bacterium]